MPPISVPTLSAFKGYVRTFSVKTIYCLFQPNTQGSPPIGLRLYFYQGSDTYFLADYTSGERLKITGIPVRTHDRRKEPYIAEEDVKAFVNKELAGILVSFDFDRSIGRVSHCQTV